MIKLRPYQQDVINDTREAFKKGFKRPLVILPCGAGKTVCFAYMAENHTLKNTHNNVWFLVHRKELIDQTVDTFDKFDIQMSNIKIDMVQTISRHLDKVTDKPTLIIFDEAHHATAKTWLNIIEKYPDVPIVGLTATPCRLNGDSLGKIFDEMVEGVDSQYLLDNGYLAPYDYYAPKIDYILPDLKGADYDVAKIEYKSKIYGDILKYIDPNRKTIIYCPNVAFSQSLAQLVGGVHFDGTTPKKERSEIIEKFRKGEIKVLLNVDLIGEGFDVPDCDCVMLVRPTQSTALFIQQSMRCLRPAPGKRAVIYDFVGNVYRHGMPTEHREWSLDKKVKCRNSNGVPEVLTRECKNCYRVYSGTDPICPYCGFNNGKTKAQIEQDEKAELERIEEVKKKKARMEVGMCKSLESLIALGKKRGYKNPQYWARNIIQSRNHKMKHI